MNAWLKCVYLRDRIGQTFEGLITTVVEFGAFVQLTAVGTDGLLHIDNLRDDEYVMEPGGRAWVGATSKRRLSLGARVHVIVTSVNPIEGLVDLALVEVEAGQEPQAAEVAAPVAPGKSRTSAGDGNGAATREIVVEREGLWPARGAGAADAARGARQRGDGGRAARRSARRRRSRRWRSKAGKTVKRAAPAVFKQLFGDAVHQGVFVDVQPLPPWHEEELVAGITGALEAEARRWCWCSTACRTRTISAPACARRMPAARWPW